MSTPSNADRVRASRLRGAAKRGARLSPPDAAWLSAYENQSRRRVIDVPAATIDAPVPRAKTPKTAAPSDSAPKPAPIDGATVTAPESYADATWIPVTPPPAEGEAPPADGKPPASEPVSGVDPAAGAAAAAKVGALLGALTAAGVAAARELAAAGTLPGSELIANLDNKTTVEAIKYVSAAGQRLVVKYGVSVGFDYEDEIVVLGAVTGSVLAIAKVRADAAHRALAAGPAVGSPPQSAAGDAPEIQPKRGNAAAKASAQAFDSLFGSGGL